MNIWISSSFELWKIRFTNVLHAWPLPHWHAPYIALTLLLSIQKARIHHAINTSTPYPRQLPPSWLCVTSVIIWLAENTTGVAIVCAISVYISFALFMLRDWYVNNFLVHWTCFLYVHVDFLWNITGYLDSNRLKGHNCTVVERWSLMYVMVHTYRSFCGVSYVKIFTHKDTHKIWLRYFMCSVSFLYIVELFFY